MSKRLSTCSVSRGTLLEPVTQWSESWTTFYTDLLSDDLVCLRVAVRTDQCKNCVCVPVCSDFFFYVCVMQSSAGHRGRQTWQSSEYHMIGVLKTVQRRPGLNFQLEVKYSVTAAFLAPSDVTFRRHKLKVSMQWKLICFVNGYWCCWTINSCIDLEFFYFKKLNNQ